MSGTGVCHFIHEKQLLAQINDISPITDQEELRNTETTLFVIAMKSLQWLQNPFVTSQWRPLVYNKHNKQLRQTLIWSDGKTLRIRYPHKKLASGGNKKVYKIAEFELNLSERMMRCYGAVMLVPRNNCTSSMIKAKSVYEELKNCPNLMKTVYSSFQHMDDKGGLEKRPCWIQKEYVDLYKAAQVCSLSLQDKFTILYEVAKTLAYLHKNHRIWGDLKASNILVKKTSLEDPIKVKVIDLDESRLILNGSLEKKLYPTIAYSAPECILSYQFDQITPINEKVDIFSFGYLLAVLGLYTEKLPGQSDLEAFLDEYDLFEKTGRLKHSGESHLHLNKARLHLNKWIEALTLFRETPQTSFWGKLLQQLFAVSPHERLSADELLHLLKEFGLRENLITEEDYDESNACV